MLSEVEQLSQGKSIHPIYCYNFGSSRACLLGWLVWQEYKRRTFDLSIELVTR